MKKVIKIIVPILTVMIIGCVVLYFELTEPVHLDFTEKVQVNYQDGDKSATITDQEDINRLITICKGKAVNDFSIPACGFGTVELKFEGKGKTVFLYPACDACDSMRLGKADTYFYCIGEENRDELVNILLKYGVTFPCA